MKTQQEYQLYYWGPHYNMVKEYNQKHSCDVKLWECVVHLSPIFGSGKVYHKQEFTEHPDFELPSDKSGYTFALTILYDDKRKEHRPVWEGSELYSKKTGTKGTVLCADSNVMGWIHIEWEEYQNLTTPISNWSWNPPTSKRTFKIGDLELPCPEKISNAPAWVVRLSAGLTSESIKFSTEEDALTFYKGLVDLLTAARDKE